MQDFEQKTKDCLQEIRFLGKRLKFANVSERSFGGKLRAIIVRKLRMLSIRRSPKVLLFFELYKIFIKKIV